MVEKSLLLLIVILISLSSYKGYDVLFSENFDNGQLEERGWYDGTACRISPDSEKGDGYIEYEWVKDVQSVQG